MNWEKEINSFEIPQTKKNLLDDCNCCLVALNVPEINRDNISKNSSAYLSTIESVSMFLKKKSHQLVQEERFSIKNKLRRHLNITYNWRCANLVNSIYLQKSIVCLKIKSTVREIKSLPSWKILYHRRYI